MDRINILSVFLAQVNTSTNRLTNTECRQTNTYTHVCRLRHRHFLIFSGFGSWSNIPNPCILGRCNLLVRCTYIVLKNHHLNQKCSTFMYGTVFQLSLNAQWHISKPKFIGIISLRLQGGGGGGGGCIPVKLHRRSWVQANRKLC